MQYVFFDQTNLHFWDFKHNAVVHLLIILCFNFQDPDIA